ncbi:hypothetical protein [Streptomyces sp.]|jgi:hypothetical protein|uniref:hypothetical protein n=1 Tax=Streptomyces sp. TaxID=1931 RepID=UPI002F94F39F
MALLVVVACLAGVVGAMMKYRITSWWELILLTGFGVLSTVAWYSGAVAEFWAAVTAWAN